VVILVGLVGGLYDAFTGKIPNWLTFSSMGLGLVIKGFSGDFSKALVGLIVGILIYWPFFAFGYMGGGDVKLMGAIGCFTGVDGVLYTALLGSIFGGLLALIALCRKQKYVRYGIAIGLGLVTFEVLQWLNWPLPLLY